MSDPATSGPSEPVLDPTRLDAYMVALEFQVLATDLVPPSRMG